MKPVLTAVLATAILAVSPVNPVKAQNASQTMTMPGEGRTIVMTEGINWQPGPAALPPGAQSAVLYGNPAAEGEEFTMRLNLPAGYRIPPHTHPNLESVTVISGSLQLGMGETFVVETMQPLEAGSFFAMPPGMTHYVYTDEGAEIQLNGVGPWNIEYVRPMDDPRRVAQR